MNFLNIALLFLPLMTAVFTVLLFVRDKKVSKEKGMKAFSFKTLLSVFCHNSGKHADIRDVHDIFINGVL